MRDFVSAFAQGLAGANKGFVVGYELGERTQERKRKAAEDKATAAYRTSQAAETSRHNRATEGTAAINASTAQKRLGIAARQAATGERNATTAEGNAATLAEYRQAAIAGKKLENQAKFIKLAQDGGWDPGLEAGLERSIKGYKAKSWQEFLDLEATGMGEAPPAAPAAPEPMPGAIPQVQNFADGGLVEDPSLPRPDRIRHAGALGRVPEMRTPNMRRALEPRINPLGQIKQNPALAMALPGQVTPAMGGSTGGYTMPVGNTGIVPPMTLPPAPLPGALGQLSQGGRLRGYADGGLVTDDRETIIAKAPAEAPANISLGSPKTPSGKVRIAKDQSRMGGELTESLRSAHQQALKLGIEAMAEEAQAPAPAAGPAPAPAPSPGGALAAGKTSMGGPDQAGQVQNAFKGEPALSTEEWETALKAVDPEGKLPEQRQEIEVLARSMEYYTKAGKSELAKKFAKSLLDRSRLIAATYGGAAEAAIQKGEFADAAKMLTEGWNNHVPDGSSLIFSENGMAVLRDVNGKVQAEFEPTAENLMAGALGLKDGSAWFEAVTRTAGEGLTAKQEAEVEAEGAAPKVSLIKARQDLNKLFRGEEGEADLIADALQPSFAASGVDIGDVDTFKKRVKPVREAVQHVATELVMGSDGALPPEAAAEVAAQLTAVDPEDPTRSPFQVRLNRDKKTKKPTTLDILVNGEVYKLPHQSLPQVKKLIQFQQEQAALVAEKLATAKTAADTQAATDAKRAAAAQQRNEGFKAAAGTAGEAIGSRLGRAGEQFSRLPETLRNLDTPRMPNISGAAGWLKRQIPTTEGKKLNQRP